MSVSQSDVEQKVQIKEEIKEEIEEEIEEEKEEKEKKKMKMLKKFSREIDDLVYKYSTLLIDYNETVHVLCGIYQNGCNEYNRKIGIVNNKMKEKQKSIDKFNELILKVDSKNPQIRERKIEKLKFSLDLEIESLKTLNEEKDYLLKEMIKYEQDSNPNTDLRLKEMLNTMEHVKKQYSSAVSQYKMLRSTMN